MVIRFRKHHIWALTLVLAIVTLSTLTLMSHAKSSYYSPTAAKQMQHGNGFPVRFTSSNSTDAEIDSTVKSAGNFLYQRSGLRMSRATQNRLSNIEQKFLRNNSPLVNLSTVKNILGDVSIEHLRQVTDSEVRDATNLLTGQRSRRFQDGISQSRNLCNIPSFEAGLRSRISREVDYLVGEWSVTFPEQFGNAASNGVTPIQAFLIAYSVASGDQLSGAVSTFRHDAKTVSGVEEIQRTFPFSINDGISSTPTALVFNSKTVHKLLDKIAETGGQR